MIERSILKNGGLLTVFALITTGVVVATNLLTKERILEQEQMQRIALLNSVIPTTLYDNELLKSCITVNNTNLGEEKSVYIASLKGTATALAIETTAKDGYSGDIDLLVGVDLNGKVLGVRVLKHKETPGLGDKIDLSVSDWILSFNNKTYSANIESSWRVKKDGGQFDQFTGATITPRAVVKNVADTLNWAAQNQQELIRSRNTCDTFNYE